MGRQTLDFRLVCIFLLLYFIRPHDWLPGLYGVEIFKPFVAAGIWATITRPRGFRVKDLVQTPHEWIMVIYLAYCILLTDPGVTTNFKFLVSQIAIFFLVAQALKHPERIERFFRSWTVAVFAVAIIALLVVAKLDITGARPRMDGKFGGRLMIKTFLLDNPNALGHTVITLVPLAYFMFFWRRLWTSRIMAVPMMAIAVATVYFTESKGAFLSGLCVIFLAITFGRPLVVKLVMIGVAVGGAGALLATLPRMTKMSEWKDDEGVQGRMMAWEMAWNSALHKTTGAGLHKFEAWIEVPGEDELINKATHSSWVKIGGDLGYTGLFLYIAGLCVALRTVMLYKAPNLELERIRRVLFCLLMGYIISNWMIDRAYHHEYFMMIGATAALQRQLVAHRRAQAETAEPSTAALPPARISRPTSLRPGRGTPTPALAQQSSTPEDFHSLPGAVLAGAAGGGAVTTAPLRSTFSVSPGLISKLEETFGRRGKAMWNRLSIVDALWAYLAFKAVVRTWEWVMRDLMSLT